MKYLGLLFSDYILVLTWLSVLLTTSLSDIYSWVGVAKEGAGPAEEGGGGDCPVGTGVGGALGGAEEGVLGGWDCSSERGITRRDSSSSSSRDSCSNVPAIFFPKTAST